MNYMVNRGKTTCWVSGQLFSRGFHAFPGRFPGRGGGYLILLLAWPCCCSRLGLLWFSELGLQDFQVVGLLGVVGPRSLKLPGVHHSPSRSPQSLPLPFPQPAVSSFPAARSLKLPGVHHSPFSQFQWSQSPRGSLATGGGGPPPGVASRVRCLRFRSPCECNLLPMGHGPPALIRAGSKGCIVPVATEWEPCPGSLTISPRGGLRNTPTGVRPSGGLPFLLVDGGYMSK